MKEEIQRIDLNDYVQTGEGGTALTYNHKDGKTLAKLFMSTIAADNAAREFRINQVVYESGLPTPEPIRLITDGVPEWDLGMMYYSTHFLSPERADGIFHLDNDTLRAHWDAFAPVYYDTDSEDVLEAEVGKLKPYIATKMAFIISKMSGGKHAFSGPLLQLFDRDLPK